MLHPKPGTALKGEQRPIGHNGPPSILEIAALADEFAHGSIELNDLLHGLLK